MNYNTISKPPIQTHLQIPINFRGKLDTGLKCNYKCSFCYYQNNLDDPHLPLEEIKNRVDLIFESGMKEIDLSGGESSIHPDWFEILEYCRDKFMNVSCLSNGSKLKDFAFAEMSQISGLNEVLFSLHGWDEKSHDKIVGHNKAFQHIIQAIENCNILGIKVRINCTVTDFNAANLDYYAELIKKLDPEQLNLLPLNYWEDAGNIQTCSYEPLARGIKVCINNLKETDIEINVRYIPYCFMKGFEEYVVGTFQHIYDLGDWNLLTYDAQTPIENTIEAAYNRAQDNRVNSYNKPRDCSKCKFFLICDGVEKQYKEPDIEIQEGAHITNIMEFRKC